MSDSDVCRRASTLDVESDSVDGDRNQTTESDVCRRGSTLDVRI